MKGVILDADSLGHEIDLSPITDTLDEWDVHASTLTGEVPERIDGAAVVLSNKIPLKGPTLREANELRFISVMATGTNNVDLEKAAAQKISVSNAVGYATPSVVQHTLSLILALSNNLMRYVEDVRSGAWQRSNVFCLLDHPIVELSGKTLGIVGYGELGSNVARAAEAFGMRIMISARPGAAASGNRVPFETVLANADYISLHCPLTPETEHVINRKTLTQMKPGAFLVNTARGGLVQSSDLIDALEAGAIAGAAVDVLDQEPPASGEPLTSAGLPNLLVTPHNAWGAIESRTRLVEQMRENIDGFLAGTPVRVVN